MTEHEVFGLAGGPSDLSNKLYGGDFSDCVGVCVLPLVVGE